jgi:hypothetical protein
MYVDEILEWASSNQLDPHALIAEVGAINQTRVDEAVLKSASLKTPGEKVAHAIPEGLLTLPNTTEVSEIVRAAENLAAKRGVTCTLWIVGGGGDTQAEVVDDVDHVDVRILGNPRLAIDAASRAVTQIRVLPSCGQTASKVRSWTSLRVESADQFPAEGHPHSIRASGR